jgi:hypothetical protein
LVDGTRISTQGNVAPVVTIFEADARHSFICACSGGFNSSPKGGDCKDASTCGFDFTVGAFRSSTEDVNVFEPAASSRPEIVLPVSASR